MYASPAERSVSALAALGIVLAAVVALLFGLASGEIARQRAGIVAVFVDPPAPRPTPEASPEPRPAVSAARGEAGARALKADPAPLVAPAPAPLALAPVPLAAEAGTGSAAAAGASDLAGRGSGAGGSGAGRGGGGNGVAQWPRQIGGRLPRSLSRGLLRPGDEVPVRVRYTVDVNGRPAGCRAAEPGAIPELDSRVCREIEQRFLFRPARDRADRPVPSVIVEGYVFFLREGPDAAG